MPAIASEAPPVDPARRAELGQFLTPAPIAARMASFFESLAGDVRLLDAGAGTGTLLAAASRAAARSATRIAVTAFEIDPVVRPYLAQTLASLRDTVPGFESTLIGGDFLASDAHGFTHAILNPPYKKLRLDAPARRRMRERGLDVSNLYAAFVALAIERLVPGGELVAITPRSFCNGPYFRAFRRYLLRTTAVRRLHLIAARTEFDGAIQETVIVHLVKGAAQGDVVVSSDDAARTVPFDEVVHPGDAEQFLHLVLDEDPGLAARFDALPCRLADLGLAVSTGKVVDFRVRAHLRAAPGADSLPLVYPAHFAEGRIVWPRAGKKPNALADVAETAPLWMPTGHYVLVKRFSAKEDPRRVVAALFSPAMAAGARIGFENHLDVFHAGGAGLAPPLAAGLCRYLQSAVVDRYFRQFNGHTQVNATDLRSLRYPSAAQLVALGERDDDVDQALADVTGLVSSSR